MSGIPFAESPLAGAAVAAVLTDRVADRQDPHHDHLDNPLSPPSAAAAAVTPAAMSTPSVENNSLPSSTYSRRTPAIEVLAIHREAPVSSPTSFVAHFEAAAQRHSGLSTPNQDVLASLPRSSEGGEGVDIPIDVVGEEEGIDGAAVPCAIPDEETQGIQIISVTTRGVTEDVDDSAYAAHEVESNASSVEYVVENEVGETAADVQVKVVKDVVMSSEAPHDHTVDATLHPTDTLAAPESNFDDSDDAQNTRSSGVRACDVAGETVEEEEEEYVEIPIHENETAQFVLIRPRRSSASWSANSPMRASGSTAPGGGSGSRHDSPSGTRATRLSRGQQPELLMHPFSLVRRSSSSVDNNTGSGNGIPLLPISGQNSTGSQHDVVNADDSTLNRQRIPSASTAAPATHPFTNTASKPPQNAHAPSPTTSAARTSAESRIVRGPSATQSGPRQAAAADATSVPPLPLQDTTVAQAGADVGSDDVAGRGRRRLGSVSFAEVSQTANRREDATKRGASQETIKGYVYVLMEQHGSTVRVWEDRVHTAEVYRDKPLRTGGLPDPLRPSDQGFLERADRTLGIHLAQLTEARQLLGSQLELPVAQRAQPTLVVRNDPYSPLAPAKLEAAWGEYCHRFHDSLDDLLVQTAYLQRRVDALLHPAAAAAGRVSGFNTPRGSSSRAGSLPTTPRGQPQQASTGRHWRALQPPQTAKEFTWSMPTRATSRPRDGSSTPRRRVSSRPASRASSAPSTPRGMSSVESRAPQSTSERSPPPRIGRPTTSPLRGSRASGSAAESSLQGPIRRSVQRGSQPIAPGYRAAAAPMQTRTDSPSMRRSTGTTPILGISDYDRSTPYGQLSGTPRKQAAGGDDRRGQSGFNTPTRGPAPTSPVKTPTSPATSTVSAEERMSLTMQLAALEARKDTLQAADLAQARGIFTDLYGPETGLKQYCNWVDRLALEALKSA